MGEESNIIKRVLESCSALGIYQKRGVTDQNCDLVFYTKDIAEWNKLLTDILGPAIKPANTAPTKEDTRLASKYGGITNKQTLFKKEHNNINIIAMLWPWQDNEHTTLKIACQSK